MYSSKGLKQVQYLVLWSANIVCASLEDIQNEQLRINRQVLLDVWAQNYCFRVELVIMIRIASTHARHL